MVFGYRTARVVNLSVGAYYVAGAFLLHYLLADHLPDILALGIILVIGFAVGTLQEAVAFKPLRASSPAINLLSSVAVAFVLEGLVIAFAGEGQAQVPKVIGGTWRVFGAVVSGPQILLVALAVCASVLSYVWLRYTNLGRLLVATTDDAEAAQVIGADVDRLRLIVAGLSGGVASIVGALSGHLFLIDYTVTLPIAISAFVAAFISGGRSPLLALLGGMGLGLVGAFAGRYTSVNEAELVTSGTVALIILVIAQRQRVNVASGDT